MPRTEMTSYEWADSWIKGFGFVALVVSGIFAIIQYREANRVVAKNEFVQRQMSTVDQILADVLEIDGELDPDKKKQLAANLDNTIMVKGRAYLNGSLYGALAPTRDHINVCLLKRKLGDCQWDSTSQSTVGFAKAARENFDRVWQVDLEAVAAEEPYIGKQ